MSISESYSADSRTALAADRTIFAAERTYVPGCGPVLRHAPLLGAAPASPKEHDPWIRSPAQRDRCSNFLARIYPNDAIG